MFEKLYSIKLPLDRRRQELYIKGDSLELKSSAIFFNKNQSLDLTTYFNLFSVQKWKKYTSIREMRVKLQLQGHYRITAFELGLSGKRELLTFEGQGDCEKDFSLDGYDSNFITFTITALEDNVQFLGGAYYGQFDESEDTDIGIVICTFKREEYLNRNLETLKQLMEENPHFHVMVIDNGQTLPEKQGTQLQIIHNRNYGGSGGFTRGLMEQVDQGINDYVLMMDDDILIETSSLERVYALCRHRKSEFQMQMIAGSMMSMEEPTIQHENTAYWGKVRLHSLGQGLDLTSLDDLIQNDDLPSVKNKYAAWWFCCIPLAVIQKNGYPLPNFIKGDDMEYGIRNHQDIITMNGIGVWHEAFAKKMSPVISYFSDRNMLIMNHYAFGCGQWTFLFSAAGRLGKHTLRRSVPGIQMLHFALQDYKTGYEGITAQDGDEKFQQIRQYKTDDNLCVVLMKTIALIISCFIHYPSIHKKYIDFRSEKLMTQQFWKKYLHVK